MSGTPRDGDMGFLKTILESAEDVPSSDGERKDKKDESGSDLKSYGSFASLNDYIDGVADAQRSNTDSTGEISDENYKDGRMSRLSIPQKHRRHRSHGSHHEASRRHRHREPAKTKQCWDGNVLDNLGDKLEQKYEELHGLLYEQLSSKERHAVRHQVDQAKQLVKEFALSSRGMPTTPPVTLTYVPDPISPRSDCGTQTYDAETTDDEITHRSSSRSEKHVSFALVQTDDDLQQSFNSTKRDDSYNYGGVLKKSREQFHGKKVIRKVQREQKKPASALDVGDVQALQQARLQNAKRHHKHQQRVNNSSGEVNIIESRENSPRENNRLTSQSAPFINSDGVDMVGDREHHKADYNLKNTDDPLLLNWLHRKNVERKSKKIEKREKRKKKRQEKIEDAEKREQRKEEATLAMESWLKKKQKEVTLLKKRAKISKKTFENTHVESLEEKSESKNDIGSNNKKHDASKNVKHDQTHVPTTRGVAEDKKGAAPVSIKTPRKKCNKGGCDEAIKCTCGYLEAKKLHEMEERQAEQARKARLRAIQARSAPIHKPSKSSELPQHSKTSESEKTNASCPGSLNANGKANDTNTSQNEGEESKNPKETRISYDDWLAQKRKQDVENKQKLAKEKKDKLNKSDPDLVRIIPDLVKKRVDNILNGKKKIDTGITEVDAAANAYPSRPATDPPSESPENNNSPNTYKWIEQQSDDVGGSENVSINTNPTNTRPSSGRSGARRRPQTAKVRPSSAKPNFTRPVPPRSASSPTPRSRIENITHASDNPFKIPFPPGPKKPSRLHEEGFRGRKFATYIWDSVQDEERPEPQGSDNPQPVPAHDVNDSVKHPHMKPENAPNRSADVATEKALVPKIRTSDTPSEGAFMTSLQNE